MKRLGILFLIVVLVVAAVGRVGAANLQEELQKLATENAQGYLGPFSTVFGTSMNSGLYHTAKPHSLLGFDISIKITGVAVSDDDKTFDFILPHTIPAVTIPGIGNPVTLDPNLLYPDRKTPTVFGETEQVNYTATEDGLYNALVEAGYQNEADILRATNQLGGIVSGIPQIPSPVRGTGLPGGALVMPQVSLGLPFKSEVLLRYAPEIDAGEVGKVKFWGVGLKHSISQWVPVPMGGIDLSGQFVIQKLEVGSLLESNHWAFNVEASRRFGLFIINVTPYAGVGLESSDLSVHYTVPNPNNDPFLPTDGTIIGLDLDGKNKARMTAGLRFGLFGILTLNADYSMGKYDAYSLGLGLTLR